MAETVRETKDYSGACWNALMEEETKESIARLYIDGLDARRAEKAAVAELVEALGAILADMPVIDCDRLHHTKKDLHKAGPCPVEIRLEAAISRAHMLIAKHAAKP